MHLMFKFTPDLDAQAVLRMINIKLNDNIECVIVHL